MALEVGGTDGTVVGRIADGSVGNDDGAQVKGRHDGVHDGDKVGLSEGNDVGGNEGASVGVNI